MGRRRILRSTCINDRAMFIRMWMSGIPSSVIAQETGSTATTVRRWIRKWRREGNINGRRRGRPVAGKPQVIYAMDARPVRALNHNNVSSISLNQPYYSLPSYYHKLFVSDWSENLMCNTPRKFEHYPVTSVFEKYVASCYGTMVHHSP